MASVIVYGPQGCGKTRHAPQLQRFFKCAKVIEEDCGRGEIFRRGVFHALATEPERVKGMNALVLTHEQPPADLSPEASRRVLSFHDAMRIAGIKPTRI